MNELGTVNNCPDFIIFVHLNKLTHHADEPATAFIQRADRVA